MTQAAILMALGALGIGLLAGLILGRRLAASSGADRRLAELLRTREQRLQIQERQLAEHFERTATLTDALDHAMEELRSHLAAGAGNLVNVEMSRRIAPRASNHQAELNLEAPRDYAPSQGLLRGERPEAKLERAPSAPAKPLQLVGDEDDPTLKVG